MRKMKFCWESIPGRAAAYLVNLRLKAGIGAGCGSVDAMRLKEMEMHIDSRRPGQRAHQADLSQVQQD